MFGLLSGSFAGFANARALLEETDFPARKTTVVDEFIAHGAPRPAPSEHRFVAVQALVADLAVSGFNPEQHRLPVTATIAKNIHGAEV
ncbi:MAG: hypothetical protein H8K09_02375 [Nitrospira sp.]|nr:hypothetical protein [Nitrospira sp.]